MLTPGMTIGGLRLDRLLGRGAMGEVYLAEQLSLKRPVAVKRIADHLLDNPEAIARFEREAQCVARLQSPHVVQVFDFLRLADAEGTEHCLIVMELVEGGMSLRDCLGQGPLSWQQAASLALQAAEGLAAALDTGVVHRDVKPDNIMLNRHGVAKLADFGLARAVDSTAMTQEGSLLGTPNYIAPEGCRGEVVGHSGDLYSLGATWFHLATGQPPYRAENLMALLRLHLEGDIPKLRSLAPETPAPLADLVEACLAKDPADRPASARALVDALQALATQGIVIPSRVSELVSAHKVDPGQTTVATAHGAAADTAPLLTAGPGSDAPTVATVMPDRPASHDKLGQATAATVVAGEVPTLAQPSPVAPQAVTSKSRILPMIAGLAVLVLATGAGVGLWLQSRPDQHDEQQAQATPSPAPQVTNSLPAAPATSDPAPPEAAIPATTIASAASSSPPATPAPEPANPSTVTATTTPASPSTATPATELASPSTPVPAPDADSPATATANTATPSPVTPQTPLAAPVETPVVVATTATPQATPPSATPPTATPVTAA
ncbi:MAG: protein kinase, partial [Planctomycetota bacterium]|nr:protein kinase [Planctomycetota bacterium]